MMNTHTTVFACVTYDLVWNDFYLVFSHSLTNISRVGLLKLVDSWNLFFSIKTGLSLSSQKFPLFHYYNYAFDFVKAVTFKEEKKADFSPLRSEVLKYNKKVKYSASSLIIFIFNKSLNKTTVLKIKTNTISYL